MRNPIKTNVDAVSIYRATDNAKHRVKDLKIKIADFDNDPKKSERVEKSLCKHCFYIANAHIGGAMFTSRECGLCKEVQTYSSTATQPLCLPCAKENGLCKQCGGDVEMKHRRKSSRKKN